MARGLPIHAVMPGRCFRRDTPDARHLAVFHQVEGLVVDRGITFGDLAGTIETFTGAYFGPDIHSRLRPAYFPFTEPSAEFEITCTICRGAGCRTCSGTGWIELGRLRHGRPGGVRGAWASTRTVVGLRLRLRDRPLRPDAPPASPTCAPSPRTTSASSAVLRTVRAPLSWLRDFAPFTGEPAELAAALDDLGLVVEGVERVGEGLGDIVVARVEVIAAIPGADRIRRVVVDAGDGPLEVVCGAPNFAEGDLVPLAPVGAILPDGSLIARRKMRGVVSNGMLCSGRELGPRRRQRRPAGAGRRGRAPGRGSRWPRRSASSPTWSSTSRWRATGPTPGAWPGWPATSPPGSALPFRLPDPAPVTARAEPAAALATLSLEDPELCPRLTARVLTGVRVGPSPRWLARRLTLAGMRPINNVVDASNYVMLELGQPTHPYDLRPAGRRGPAGAPGPPGRDARDPRRRHPDPGHARPRPRRHRRGLVICDAEDMPVGIGGIMGGASSEISTTPPPCCWRRRTSPPWPSPAPPSAWACAPRPPPASSGAVTPGACSGRATASASCWPGSATTAPGVLHEEGEVPAPLRLAVPVARVNELLGTDLTARRWPACSSRSASAASRGGDPGGDRPDQPPRRPAGAVRGGRRGGGGGPGLRVLGPAPPLPGLARTGRSHPPPARTAPGARRPGGVGRPRGVDRHLRRAERPRPDRVDRSGGAGGQPAGQRRGAAPAQPAARAARRPGVQRRPPTGRGPALRGGHGVRAPRHRSGPGGRTGRRRWGGHRPPALRARAALGGPRRPR